MFSYSCTIIYIFAYIIFFTDVASVHYLSYQGYSEIHTFPVVVFACPCLYNSSYVDYYLTAECIELFPHIRYKWK